MYKYWRRKGALLLCPCLFCPSDNVWRSRRADAPRCAHFSTVISPSWITEQISVGKCAHRSASARWKLQTSFKIVTWTKETLTKHHNTGEKAPSYIYPAKVYLEYLPLPIPVAKYVPTYICKFNYTSKIF